MKGQVPPGLRRVEHPPPTQIPEGPHGLFNITIRKDTYLEPPFHAAIGLEGLRFRVDIYDRDGLTVAFSALRGDDPKQQNIAAQWLLDMVTVMHSA